MRVIHGIGFSGMLFVILAADALTLPALFGILGVSVAMMLWGRK